MRVANWGGMLRNPRMVDESNVRKRKILREGESNQGFLMIVNIQGVTHPRVVTASKLDKLVIKRDKVPCPQCMHTVD